MPSSLDAAAPSGATGPASRMEEVEQYIREFISRNDLQPGHRLPGESWFAEQLGAGRPLVREAMRGLEAVGVIEARRGSGRYVGAFDPAAYLSRYTTEMLLSRYTERELLETRCILEIAMASDAAVALTDDDLAEISRLWISIQESAARNEASTDADLALHRVIMSRAENRIIVAMLDAVHALAVQRLTEGGHWPDRIAEDLSQHEAIVLAALARNGAAVRNALMTHFETTASRLGFEPRWREIFAAGSAPTTTPELAAVKCVTE